MRGFNVHSKANRSQFCLAHHMEIKNSRVVKTKTMSKKSPKSNRRVRGTFVEHKSFFSLVLGTSSIW